MRGFVALAAVTLVVSVAAVVNDMDRDTILDRYTVMGSCSSANDGCRLGKGGSGDAGRRRGPPAQFRTRLV